MHILLLEDDILLNEIMVTAIESARSDIDLKTFVDSSEAYDYIATSVSDITLFILDIRVPGQYNGFELAEKIRELDPDASIILTSAYQRPATKKRMEELKLEWHGKPWHVFEIQKRIAGFKSA